MSKTVQEGEMEGEATLFLSSLMPGERATVVTLSGDLGAGKTTFVKGIARALHVEEHVTSPTFVILKIYDLHDQAFSRLIHMDAYRLKGKQHLKVLGWDALLSDPQNLILIEWPEKIGDAIPEGARGITFRYSGKDREIVYG